MHTCHAPWTQSMQHLTCHCLYHTGNMCDRWPLQVPVELQLDRCRTFASDLLVLFVLQDASLPTELRAGPI